MGLSAGSRYAYSLADACTSDNPFLVWMKLKGSSAFLCLVFTMDFVLALQSPLAHWHPVNAQRATTPTAAT
jgi:hypothetical protein